jgi:capsular polysaccharide biosynthesis protein
MRFNTLILTRKKYKENVMTKEQEAIQELKSNGFTVVRKGNRNEL